MERELGGFADGTEEDAQSGSGGETGMITRGPETERATGREGRFEVEEIHTAAIRTEEQQDADHEAEVTDAVGEEGFFAGFSSAGFLIPVTDEQVGTQTDELPEDCLLYTSRCV